MSVAELQERDVTKHNGYMTKRYLSTVEIAALWDISRPAVFKWFKDVEPDAKIGETRGWSIETVDEVNATRKGGPGPGNWGPRQPKEK